MSKIRNTPPHGHGSAHHKPGQQQQQPYRPGVAQPKIAGAQQPRTPPTAPPAYRPQPAPKCLQAKMPAAHQQGAPQNRTPTAPPAYRPQAEPKCLQPKVVNGQQSQAAAKRVAPVAPPVYRPGAVPKVLQTKQSAFDKPARVKPPARPPVNNQIQLARAGTSRAGTIKSNNVVQRTIWQWDGVNWQVYRPTANQTMPVNPGTAQGELYDDEKNSVVKAKDVLDLHRAHAFQHGIEKHIGETAKPVKYEAVYKAFTKEWNFDKKKQINRLKKENQLPKTTLTDTDDIASVARILYAVHPGKGNVLDLPANSKVIPKMAGGFKTRNDFLDAERTVWNLIGTMSLANIKSQYLEDENIEDEVDDAVAQADANKVTVKWKSTTDKDGVSYTGILVSMPLDRVWPNNPETHLFGRQRENPQTFGPNIYPQSAKDMQAIIESGYKTKRIDYTTGGVVTAVYRDYETGNMQGRHLTTLYVRPVQQ